MLTKFVRNISWLTGANLVFKPLWFVFITAVCMRYLGAKDYGYLTAALALGLTATAITDLGANRFSVREMSKNPAVAPQLAANFFSLKLFLFAIAFIVSLAAGALLDYDSVELIGLSFATAYAVSLQLLHYCRGFYQATADLRLEAVSIAAEKIAVILLGSTALLVFRTPVATLAGMAIGIAGSAIGNVIWIRRRLFSFELADASITYIKKQLPTLIPLGLLGFLGVAYLRIDVIMIEYLTTSLETGQYSAAFRILEALMIIPAIIVIATAYPALARLYGKLDLHDFKLLVLKVSFGTLLLSLCVAIFINQFSAPLVALIDSRPEFSPASSCLRILVWTLPILSVNSVLHSALLAVSRERIMLATLSLALVANVCLNLVLIPHSGILGASYATLIAEVALLGLLLLVYPNQIRKAFNQGPSVIRE